MLPGVLVSSKIEFVMIVMVCVVRIWVCRPLMVVTSGSDKILKPGLDSRVLNNVRAEPGSRMPVNP